MSPSDVFARVIALMSISSLQALSAVGKSSQGKITTAANVRTGCVMFVRAYMDGRVKYIR